jgi:Tfp pilus assembly protein PilZ
MAGREPDRRKGLARVPLVRRCRLRFADGRETAGFIVNINVLGAYVTLDGGDLPTMGEDVTCRFALPDHAPEIEAAGPVSWLNPRQAHPVHSLPPGFGLRFERLPSTGQRAIEDAVEDYVRRRPALR